MSERHVIVFFRDTSWQFTHQGVIRASFKSREDAVAAAIAAAEAAEDPELEVIVQDPGMSQETVWRSGG